MSKYNFFLSVFSLILKQLNNIYVHIIQKNYKRNYKYSEQQLIRTLNNDN